MKINHSDENLSFYRNSSMGEKDKIQNDKMTKGRIEIRYHTKR